MYWSSLRKLLIVPFVLQIVGTVSLVGYLSFRNGQQVVVQLANQLMDKANRLVDQHLDSYLGTPQQINQVNLDAIQLKLLNLNDFEQVGHFFWKQMQVFNVGYLNYANQQGEFIGVERLANGQLLINETLKPNISSMSIYRTDRQGNRLSHTVEAGQAPIQTEGWYAAAVEAKQPIWSPIYQWDDKPEVLSISSSYPVYDHNQTLIGVIGADLLLSNISEFLRSIQISPSARIFIIERDGSIVATSTDRPAYLVVDGKAKRLNVLDSSDPLIQTVAHSVQESFNSFGAIQHPQKLTFEINHEREFVQIMPWQDRFGLNWLVVIILPESDFMAQINHNTLLTIALCVATFFLSVVIGIFTARRITHPILQLNQAAKAIAAGKFDQSITIKHPQELRELSTSFNWMAEQLQTSFQALAQTNQELEQRVQERTASLTAAEAELRGLFEAMTELIFVLDRQGRYLKITSASSGLLYAPPEELLGKTVHEIFPAEIADQIVRHVCRVLDQQCPFGVEYSLPFDDQEVWFAANISPTSSDTVVWVARNISEQKQAEVALRAKNEELTQTLQQLQTTQNELIQSEKMAALGQLVAGIAHEINTPLGAIQASIGNISSALDQSMQQLPQLFQVLPPDRLASFFQLLDLAHRSPKLLSFREERQLRRALKQTLEANTIPQAERVADILSKMGICLEDICLEDNRLLPLLQLPNHLFVLNTAYQLSIVQNNSQNIMLAVERAAKIVFALKNYARQDYSGKKVEASIPESVDTILTLYHSQIKQGVEVYKHYASVPKVLCYPEELTQVWSNLIHNALQAMDYHGDLTITVKEQDQHVVVQISDSGCGIPADIRDRIFEPFFTTKPMGEGSGLGLDIVRRIVAKHQGKVELESQSGHTIFSVWLPMV